MQLLISSVLGKTSCEAREESDTYKMKKKFANTKTRSRCIPLTQ